MLSSRIFIIFAFNYRSVIHPELGFTRYKFRFKVDFPMHLFNRSEAILVGPV